MHIAVAGGTGFIGQFLIKQYLDAGRKVTVISRSKASVERVFSDTVNALEWQALSPTNYHWLNEIDLIINLAGASIAEKRWSAERKQALIDSRVIPTQKLVALCSQLGQNSPPLFNASAVSVYGTQIPLASGLPAQLTEDTPIDFDHPVDFSSTITRRWEKTTHRAKDKGVRVVNMRFGVVFANKGGALQRMALPFKFFIGGKIGSGRQPLPWVTRVDLYRAIEFLIEHADVNGPVNIVSPQCVTQEELAECIGKLLNRPSIVPTPAFVMKLAFGQMASELILEGQNVFPKVLIDHGFKFEYGDLKSALRYAL